MSQHDLDLANAAGASFRSDLNSALVALGTLQSGASAPATTFAYMLWADTTNGLLKQRNAANSGWIVRGALAESFVLSRSSNTILAGADLGKAIIATAAFTQTLTAAATLGDGWFCDYNAQGFSIVLDPNGSEQIDGATTKTVTGSGRIYCNGSAFFTIGFPTAVASGGFYAPTASVGANALTVTIPSGTVLNFNDGTSVTLGASISTTISSGSTLGTVSGQYSCLWIAAVKNSGTPEVAVRNNWNNTTESLLGFDLGGTISTTAEGGAGAADSAQVWYSTTLRASQPWCPVGFVISSQATAGTWATSPITTKGVGPGTPMPGAVIQDLTEPITATSTGATTTPWDNSIPQNTEGNQIGSGVAITPIGAANVIEVEPDYFLGEEANSGNHITGALHVDSVVNAISSDAVSQGGNASGSGLQQGRCRFIYRAVANNNTLRTYKFRAGCDTGTVRWNGVAGAGLYNGTLISRLSVKEIQS